MAAVVMLAAAGACPAAEKITWKPLELVMLRIDEKPAKIWKVYHVEKRNHLLLLALGQRFILIDAKAQEVYELDPAKLERKGEELRWIDTDRPARPLASSDWLIRDVGPANRIRFKLTVEGRSIDLQVPITNAYRLAY